MSSDAARRVLVTGAGKRIGRSIAIALARRGFEIALHYNTSRTEAEEVSRACGGAPLFQANLAQVNDIRRLFQQLREQFGLIDTLVNNAGRFAQIDPMDITEADWDYIHNVNLKGTFFCCQEGARDMLELGHGRIVNITSLGGIRPWAEHAHYCASKAGLIMLTQALSKAWAPQISVNGVAPGVIPFEQSEPRLESLIKATPMQRSGTGQEVADAVLFFLTAPHFITGQNLAVDGGLSQR